MNAFKILLFFAFILTYVKAFPRVEIEDDESFMHPAGDEIDDRDVTRANLTEEVTAAYWEKLGKSTVKDHVNRVLNKKRAKNVIFFLGDGMSIPTISAARMYLGQLQGSSGESSQLSFEKFPAIGLSKTYCVNRQVADSACSATAYLTGVKANYGTLGVTAAVPRGNCEKMQDKTQHVDSIAKIAMKKKKSSGIVTTTRVTHASPAGAYSHSAQRDWESDSDVRSSGFNPLQCRDIAHQLIHEDGKGFNVILGGGRRAFLPNTTLDEERYRGHRWDGRNLINEWKQDKDAAKMTNEYVWNRQQLLKVNTSSTKYLMGLFEGSHCEYNLEANKTTEPTLTEMVETAIKILSTNSEGYFLFAEGGRIDHAHHSTYARLAMDETAEFSKAIARAVEMTSRDDTLIVVTSDHAHNMHISGYPVRGNDILAASGSKGSDGIPYLTLSYANGPGYRPEVNGKRVDVTKENMNALKFRYPAMVPLSSETHGGDDVGVFALGPWDHIFTGVYEQSTIPHLISFAACLDDEFSACTQ
ncbi:membrane-bound alkaline phosphatase-like [Arctopsyche grandis]|uniref:membrane-bound alkaline phosphatase-like n=1 Tax=Arctopsyche grandis TaxID=121162 RepID=UPI00406D6E80